MNPLSKSVALAVLTLTLSTPLLAQTELVLDVRADGEVFILNTDASTSQEFNGYSINCEPGCLDVAGWQSISSSDPSTVESVFGAGGSSFIEANPMNTSLAELSVFSGGMLQPGASYSIGMPIDGTTAEIRDWIESGVLVASFSGLGGVVPVSFQVVPEPHAAWLFTLGVLGCLRFRKTRQSLLS